MQSTVMRATQLGFSATLCQQISTRYVFDTHPQTDGQSALTVFWPTCFAML